MSDLQIVLIIIGGLIIVAVLVLNWWQERQFHKQVKGNFSELQSDALLDGFEPDESVVDKSVVDKPILDDPSLDISKLYANEETLSTGEFYITNNALEQSVENFLEDDHFGNLLEPIDSDSFDKNISIDEAYEALAKKHKAGGSTSRLDAQSELEAEPKIADDYIEKDKLAHHVEIKAIFNDA